MRLSLYRYLRVDILLAALLFWTISTHVNATLYVASYDVRTGATGLAYSSSGANFWQTRIKGQGLIGEQAHGLCKQATAITFLQEGLTAPVIAQRLHEQCDAVGWDQYRLIIVTADGAIASVIAAQGCHSGNQVCGELRERDFLIIGGGLKNGVLEAGRQSFLAQAPTEPLHCRLFQTLTAVYAAGGEKKPFRGASITLDEPTATKLHHWEVRGEEATLLSTLYERMKQGGHPCDFY